MTKFANNSSHNLWLLLTFLQQCTFVYPHSIENSYPGTNKHQSSFQLISVTKLCVSRPIPPCWAQETGEDLQKTKWVEVWDGCREEKLVIVGVFHALKLQQRQTDLWNRHGTDIHENFQSVFHQNVFVVVDSFIRRIPVWISQVVLFDVAKSCWREFGAA